MPRQDDENDAGRRQGSDEGGSIEGDPDDPNGGKPGDRVEIVPDDYGKVTVSGEIVVLSSQHIAIRRHDPGAGEVVVHFVRAGFLAIPA